MSLKVDYNVLNQRDTPAMFADSFSNRPAFGFAGRLFISVDTREIYRDFGNRWELIADAGGGSGTTLQAVCTNGNTTTTDITIVSSGRLFLQALSNGGVLFPNGGSGQVSQDNTNFFWDNTNKRLGINTNTPGVAFDVHSADNVIQQLNATSTNNSLLSFLNQGTGKWRIGNFYNSANNDFYIFDVFSGTPRFYITNTGYTILPTNVIIGSSNRSSAYGLDSYVSANFQSTLRVQGASTFLSPITGNSFVKSGGTSAEILAADGSVITAGTNITISGGTISSSGGGGSISLAAIGSTPNANAATLTGSVLNLEPASASFGGVVTTGTQTFAGAKTFSGIVTGASFIPTSSTIPTNGIYLSAANTLNFATNTTNRLTIDASGNLGLNTTTIGSRVQINGNAAIGYSASTAASTNGLAVSGSVGIGIVTPSQKLHVDSTTGDGIYISSFQTTTGAINTGSSLYFAFNDGAGARDSGNIKVLKENGTSGNYASYMAFSTRANGGSITEQMRISSAGVITMTNLAGTGSRTVLADASGNLSAPVSDISVKENVKSIGYGLNEICKMNPVWFDYIDEYKNYGDGRQNGNIAQEMAEIIPEAVFTTPSTGKMGIDYDQLHAVYIKAIQELNDKLVRNNIN